jgi:hypothetical protein
MNRHFEKNPDGSWFYTDSNGNPYLVRYIMKGSYSHREDIYNLFSSIRHADNASDDINMLTVYHGMYVIVYSSGDVTRDLVIGDDTLRAISSSHPDFEQTIEEAIEGIEDAIRWSRHYANLEAQDGREQAVRSFMYRVFKNDIDGEIHRVGDTLALRVADGSEYRLVGVLSDEKKLPYFLLDKSNYITSNINMIMRGCISMTSDYIAVWVKVN